MTKVTIKTKGYDHTESIDDVINKKCTHLERHLSPSAEIDWTCSKNSGSAMTSEVHIRDGKNTFHATASDQSLYHTFDLVVEKLKNQMN